LSTSFGLARLANGTAAAHDFVVIKSLDKSSPRIMEALVTGVTIPTVFIELTKLIPDASGGLTIPVVYLRYELENVQVKSFSVGSGNQDAPPQDQLSLNFGNLTVSYSEYAANGTFKGTSEMKWDNVSQHP
jgi:type VI secretion system Hcp family effector